MKLVSEIKETGATFTPKELADFLASKILFYVELNNPTIVDPACGDGELLVSIGKQLELKAKNFKLLGFDTNENYLENAQKKIEENINNDFELIKSDFLEEIEIDHHQKKLNFTDNDTSNYKFADIVIANPPYVRTQILGSEKAQFLASKFNLKGRVDLYYPFLIAMTHALKDNGIIGVITSNKYLFTKSGDSIRKFLFENYEILEVIDLGDTKLFDAAVLPAIFIGRKKSKFTNISSSFLKIYEEFNDCNNRYTIVNNVIEVLKSPKQGYFSDGIKKYKKSSGIIRFSNTKENTWALLNKEETKWVQDIENNSKEIIGDTFKVRVGIKTTADKIFISDTWEKLNGTKPEDENLKDLISQENIKSWKICNKKKLRVLYPHTVINGVKSVINLDYFPLTKKYFKMHEKTLKNRKYLIDSGRNWYEIWVPQNPSLWQYPKLVFPDISATPRFHLDYTGKIVNGNCYWIVATTQKKEKKLLLIQGIANSKLMTKYHDLVFSNKLYSGRRRYFSQYVQNYPLPDINSKHSNTIIDIVENLHIETNKIKIAELTKMLEIQVANAYGVKPIF